MIKPNSKQDYLIFVIVIIVVILAGLTGVHNYHCYQQYQHELYIRHIKHLHHLSYLKRWHPVWQAKEHPTAHNLAQLTLGHPWNNSAMILKNNHPSLDLRKWKHDKVDFSYPDKYGRISHPATAYLSRSNVVGDALRKPQRVKPVGWHQHKFYGSYILNRGHLIAYSLTKNINFAGKHVLEPYGNQNDRNNLFTETEFCNQQLQYTFETRIRIELEKGKHIIYRVQPIFRDHELMARGVHLQAISTDKKFHLNVYLFNVQPGVTFNYKNGYASPSGNYFSLPSKMIKNSETMDEHDKRMRYQRKIMYLYKKNIISRQQAVIDEEQGLNGYSNQYSVKY